MSEITRHLPIETELFAGYGVMMGTGIIMKINEGFAESNFIWPPLILGSIAVIHGLVRTGEAKRNPSS